MCFCISLRVFAGRPNRKEGRDGYEIGVRVESREGVVVRYRAGPWNLSHFTFSFWHFQPRWTREQSEGSTVQTRLEILTWCQIVAHIFVRKGLTAVEGNTFSSNFQKRELFSIEIWNAEHWSVQTSDAFVRIRHQHSVSLAPSHSSLLLQRHQTALCFPNHKLFLRAYLLLTADEHPDSNFYGLYFLSLCRNHVTATTVQLNIKFTWCCNCQEYYFHLKLTDCIHLLFQLHCINDN